MNIKTVFFLFLILIGKSALATEYYVNAVTGKDSNKGISKNQPFKTAAVLNKIAFKPGDAILFATGQQFSGMLHLANVQGTLHHPIKIGSYTYKKNTAKPKLDAGDDLNAILLQNVGFINISGLELTATKPYNGKVNAKETSMRCGILVELTKANIVENITIKDVIVHDVYYNPKGFVRSAAEVKTANGTQSYGWGIRFINSNKDGYFKNVKILNCEVFNVCHTGIKLTAFANGIQQMEIAHNKVYQTGGPGMQFSGINDGHIHHNSVNHSGSTADSRNWGRGSGMWTWTCSNILIEHNRFENANGPGDSAGVHIDYNCNHVVVQYNVSANNAGGFCEILGNNNNCAYRYNISINDGFREKGVDGAFQEGKIFWLSGYQGNEKKNVGPYNSYFYNNSIYVKGSIVPKIAVSSSTQGVLIANNIFYFEAAAKTVVGDQKKKEVDEAGIPNVFFNNNLFLRADNWPTDAAFTDATPIMGDPMFLNKGGLDLKDYLPTNKQLIKNKGIVIPFIPADNVGLTIGLKAEVDILGNAIEGLPDIGAIEIQ